MKLAQKDQNMTIMSRLDQILSTRPNIKLDETKITMSARDLNITVMLVQVKTTTMTSFQKYVLTMATEQDHTIIMIQFRPQHHHDVRERTISQCQPEAIVSHLCQRRTRISQGCQSNLKPMMVAQN